MTESGNSSDRMPTWSLAGLMLGMRLTLPLLPGLVAFALAVGATAARKGLSLAELLLMNSFVYAGASQIVAMEIWPERITWGAIATIALVTATMNARMLLMGASLRPWLAPLPSWQTYPMLHFTTDPGWLMAMRYRAEGGSDAAVLLGSGLAIFALWLVATAAGFLLGTLIADPRKYGIDLVMPVFFATLLIPLWHSTAERGKRAIGWIVAGAVALAVERLVPGWWFIIAGAIVGAVVEGLIDEQ